jgi:hypothetical protein
MRCCEDHLARRPDRCVLLQLSCPGVSLLTRMRSGSVSYSVSYSIRDCSLMMSRNLGLHEDQVLGQ